MSDEAQEQAKPRRTKNPANKPGAPTRSRTKAKDAATSETVASPRTASTVPEVPAAPNAGSRRASTWRLGLLTTTLGLLIGGLAWFSDTPEFPEFPQADPAQIALGSPEFPQNYSAQIVVDSPNVTIASTEAQPERRDIDDELRLAAMALEIRESQESLTRLWTEARSLATSVRHLASGVESLQSDVDATRSEAVSGLARVEDRLNHVEVAVGPEPMLLGDPALRQVEIPGNPKMRLASETAQPTTTGGLPDAKASPHTSVKVSFNKSKARMRAPKPISGWLVHNVWDDLALVEGPDSFYEVRTGELLPDAGIVKAIKKNGEKWVVLTNKGMITEPK